MVRERVSVAVCARRCVIYAKGEWVVECACVCVCVCVWGGEIGAARERLSE